MSKKIGIDSKKEELSCPICGKEFYEGSHKDSDGYINCPECDYKYNPITKMEKFIDDPEWEDNSEKRFLCPIRSCPSCIEDGKQIELVDAGHNYICPDCGYTYNSRHDHPKYRFDSEQRGLQILDESKINLESDIKRDEDEVLINTESSFIQEVVEDTHRAMAACAKMGYKMLIHCRSERGKQEQTRLYELSSKWIYSESEAKLLAIEEGIRALILQILEESKEKLNEGIEK